MNRLTQPPPSEAEVNALAGAFDDVFALEPAWRPLGIWFRPQLAGNVRLLYPQNYVLSEEAFTGLRDAVAGLYNERDYAMRLLEAPLHFPLYWSARWQDGPVWSVQELPLHENCVYSRRGSWGVYFCDSSFALLSGPDELLAHFENALPESFADQEQALIEDSLAVFGPNPPDFLLPLMSRLHGPATAHEKIREAGYSI